MRRTQWVDARKKPETYSRTLRIFDAVDARWLQAAPEHLSVTQRECFKSDLREQADPQGPPAYHERSTIRQCWPSKSLRALFRCNQAPVLMGHWFGNAMKRIISDTKRVTLVSSILA